MSMLYMTIIAYYHDNGKDAYDDGDGDDDGDDDVRAVGGVRKRCLALLMR